MGRERVGFSRRHVIRGAAGASAAAAVAGVGPTQEAQAYDPGEEQTRARYRESDHVKEFYRNNRYETQSKK